MATKTDEFIGKLARLKHGELSRLRALAGRPLDQTVAGFDLFTGQWWPLREQSAYAPRRATSWLVAKLYASHGIPHIRDESGRGPVLAEVLGRREPRDRKPTADAHRRYRDRFDALLQSPLSGLEPHIGWALSEVSEAVEQRQCSGIDWAQLLDDLSIWDRGEEHRRRDVRDIWAEQYLSAAE